MKTKYVSIVTRLIVILTMFAGIAASAPAASAASRYHVSYLWHHDLERVREYRRDVARVLGRTVERNLKVVSGGQLFGLIYLRHGSSAGAVRAARVHTRLLRRAGLDAAAAVREGRWSVLDAEQSPLQQAVVRLPARPMSPPERRTEIGDLESAVSAYIKKVRRQGRLAADERTGWSVYDFTTGEKLVTINEDVRFQAASLIKPFIAATFFHRVQQGDFVYGRESRHHMYRMIRFSDNRSTNWVIRQLGGPAAVQRILRAHYGSIFQDTQIVEYIPPGGKTYRNKASVHDYSRFLYALWKKKIPGAYEIKRLMALPGSNRIFTGTNDIPEGTAVYNKTGSTARLCGDMGILSVKGPAGKTYSYIIVGLIEKQRHARNYTKWIRSRGDIIRDVSDIVYKGITRRHDFGNDL